MLTDANVEDLQSKGYTVVKDVMTSQQCDHAIGQLNDWLSQFTEYDWPYTTNSIIRGFNVAHLEPSWTARLAAKKVFAKVWKTDKLLSSFDSIAIGRPPEEGNEGFHSDEKHWLHLDQSSYRRGLHAYQGAVYLEAADEDDWTLYVMEGSHNHFDDFFDKHPKAAFRSSTNDYYRMLDSELKEMKSHGCQIKRVAVPKGGMVLWDSRLIHANANPIKGRSHPGRWRYCMFMSMTPAIWASDEDMVKKREAYNDVLMTTHWSSQGVKAFPSGGSDVAKYPREMPEIARTREAQLLSGAVSYDFRDGQPTGEESMPVWINNVYNRRQDGLKAQKRRQRVMYTAIVAAIGAVISFLGYKLASWRT